MSGRGDGRAAPGLSTQRPGAVHLLTGLSDAKLDGVPVAGDRPAGPVKDVAAQFAQVVTTPEQLPLVLDRAFRTARRLLDTYAEQEGRITRPDRARGCARAPSVRSPAARARG